jgi:hypothetical protein
MVDVVPTARLSVFALDRGSDVDGTSGEGPSTAPDRCGEGPSTAPDRTDPADIDENDERAVASTVCGEAGSHPVSTNAITVLATGKHRLYAQFDHIAHLESAVSDPGRGNGRRRLQRGPMFC